AQAATSDDHAVATGVLHHRRGVRGLEDVTVAQYRHPGAVHVLHQAGDLVPVGGAGVALGGGTPVAGDGGRALGSGDASGIEVGVVLVVDADAELHGDRDGALAAGASGILHTLDRRGDDRGVEPTLER